MSESERCPQCGGRLAEGSAEGLCARCLLTAALRHPVTTAPVNLPEPGAWIGQYRIVRPLGEGGMGLVYLAEQEEPIARQVALKIIKLGMDTRAVLARFQSEQQALALMDHPNIAQVYEAGSSGDGRPYFVMEYVPGVPITQYCDRHRLDTRQRLELFLHVAHAVQHAHQKGVIHRDLKPSNVLVTERDGEAAPKIIDFGLAKATEKHLTEETLSTEAGVMIGTPEYMSPEQAAVGARNIDTRTDIYSLGVVLYELLVGAVPFDSKALRRAGYDEVRRIIREEDPPAPAARLLSLGERAAEIAQCRATEAGALRKQVRGELDWITMKALEKDRARRYPSASEMAADIQHYLRGEPVTAGPAGAAYRLRKFVGKHRTGVAACAAVALFLVAGAAISTALYLNSERSRAAAERRSYVASLSAADSNLSAGDPDEARRNLALCPEGMRGWEWQHLLYRSDASLATFRAGSSASPVTQFAFSRDDTRVLWTKSDTLETADIQSYRRLASESGFGLKILALSQDGSRLAALSKDGPLCVYETASRRILLEVATDPMPIHAAAFSPDGGRIALGLSDGRLREIDIASRKRVFEIRVPDAAVQPIQFSPDGRRLLTVSVSEPRSSAIARVWDASNGRLSVELPNIDQDCLPVFTPDGGAVAAGVGRAIVRMWNAATGAILRDVPFAASSSTIQSIAFSPNGQLIAGAFSRGELYVHGEIEGAFGLADRGRVIGQPGEGAETRGLGYLRSAVLTASSSDRLSSIAFSPDGKQIYTGSKAGTVRVWDAATLGGTLLGVPVRRLVGFASHTDGRRVFVAAGGGTQVWDAEDGTLLSDWRASSGGARFGVVISPDGKRIASLGDDGSLGIFDDHGTPIATVGSPEGGTLLFPPAFDPRGNRIAVAEQDGTVRIWDGVPLRRVLQINTGGVTYTMAFSPDGTQLATYTVLSMPGNRKQAAVLLWDAPSGRLTRSLPAADDLRDTEVRAGLAFSPDGKLVVAAPGIDGTLWVWDSYSGRLVAKRGGHVSIVTSLAFSPDGYRLISGSEDGTIRVWATDTWESLLVLRGQSGEIGHATFTPDGSRILANDDNTVRIWDTRSHYTLKALLENDTAARLKDIY